jgi:hypothetical protein
MHFGLNNNHPQHQLKYVRDETRHDSPLNKIIETVILHVNNIYTLMAKTVIYCYHILKSNKLKLVT